MDGLFFKYYQTMSIELNIKWRHEARLDKTKLAKEMGVENEHQTMKTGWMDGFCQHNGDRGRGRYSHLPDVSSKYVIPACSRPHHNLMSWLKIPKIVWIIQISIQGVLQIPGV